jgi:AcrR family transcriptional regulator
MPKLVDHDTTRAEIRLAARRVFAERGLAGTGLTHVAREAGMGRASLYHYYSDKNALLAAVADEMLTQEGELFMRAVLDEGSALDRIVGVAATVTELFEQWGADGKVLLQLWASDLDRFKPMLSSIREDLAVLIKEGRAAGEIAADVDPRAGAALIVGMIDGLLLQYFLEPTAFRRKKALSEQIKLAVRKVLTP